MTIKMYIPKKLQKSEICQSLPARFSNLEAGPIRMDRVDGKGRKGCEAREGKSQFLKFLGYKWLLFFLFASSAAHATLRLHNDSPYKLRAVIRAADGTYLGEMIILPEHFNTWSQQYPSFGPGGQNYSEQPSRSQTPYSVQWYCLDGGQYGICENQSPGAVVLAGSCNGPKYCKPSKEKKKGPYGAHEDDEQLHLQNEADAVDQSSEGS